MTIVTKKCYYPNILKAIYFHFYSSDLPPDEYLIAFPAESLRIELHSVALVKLDAGAKFSSMMTSTDNAR